MKDIDVIFPDLQKQWFEQFSIDNHTVDIDSTVISRYGTQEGVETGYNPKKKGCGSHHPIMAFFAELKMVINAWMREGRTSASTYFQDFLSETLEILPKENIGLLCADAGFYGKKILQRLENEEIPYVIPAYFKGVLRHRVLEQQALTPFQEKKGIGMDYCSLEWQATGWTAPRRFVVIRKDSELVPQSGGKLLIPEFEAFEHYRYIAFVTNLEMSAPIIWYEYNKRVDAENRIKELKYEFGIVGFCFDSFGATEHTFRWVLVAYNLMALFRLSLLKKRKHLLQLSTINFQCIAIGSYLNKSARKKILKLSLKDRRKQFIDGLFSSLHGLSPPFQYSIE